MAKGESIADLYLRLGLNYDDLNQDFVNVENTLNSELARLNQQSSLINLKAELDLTGISDAEQKLQVEQQKLTQQIEVQTQKLKLLEAAWQNAISKNGEASTQALRAEKSFRQQELAVARLKQQLSELNSQQSAAPKNSNFLLEGYNALKGSIPSSISELANNFTKLKEASGIADGAISKLLGTIGSIPAPVAAAVAAIVAIPAAIKAIEDGLIDLARPAIEAGDAFYVMSRGMQVSIEDAEKLSTICKVTGIEISEVNSTMRRFSAQLNKAGDKDTPMLKMLERFGAQVHDSNGKIKNQLELIDELSKAWSKALDAGESAKFRDVVGGRFWTGDFITFLEDYEANRKAAEDVVRNKLFDPKRAHDIQGAINTMNAQAEQLGSAFSSALMPVAEQIVPQLTERMGELTKVIADNAEGIKNIGMAVGEVVVKVSELATGITKLAAEAGKLMLKTPTGSIVDKYKNDYTINSARDLTDKILQDDYNDAQRTVIQTSTMQYNNMIRQNADAWQAIKKFRKETNKAQKSWADFRNEVDKKNDVKALSEESLKRIEKYNEELERLKIDLQFGDDDHGKALANLELDYKKALDKAKDFEEERIAATESYGAKRALLDREYNKKIEKSISESAQRTKDLLQQAANIDFNRSHSPFEQRINEIKQWEQKSIESLQKYSNALKDTGQFEQEAAAIAANSLAKQREAFEQEIDRIKGKVQSLSEKIFEQEHSQRDIDIMRAQKQRAELLKEGIYSDAQIKRWYENELGKIRDREAKDSGGDYRRKPDLRPQEDNGNFGVIYGADLPKQKSQIEDFYGDIQNETQSQVNEFLGLAESTRELADAQSSLKQSFELIEGDKIVSTFTDSVNGVVDAQDYLAQATRDAADNNPIEEAGNTLAQALKDVAQQISESGGVATNSQPAPQSDYRDIAKYIFDALEVGGSAVAVGAGATGAIPVAAAGGGAALAGTLGNKYLEHTENLPQGNNSELPNSSAITESIQSFQTEMSSLLGELSQTTSNISANVEQFTQKDTTPPNITVSPNINIDLGGAYVFDNAMKKKLTDDITTEVANAIKNAVQSAVNSNDYGYGT